MALYRTLCKLLQRQTYTCLSSRYGIWLCIGGVLLTLISAFQFGEVLVEWSMQKYSNTFNVYHDNVGGMSFQSRLCLPVPIDIVYTWVNGSDPKLIADLEKLKLELELQQNSTKSESLLNTAKDNTSKDKTKQIDLSKHCHFANCVYGKVIILDTLQEKYITLENAKQLHPSFGSIYSIQNATVLKSHDHEKVRVVYFRNVDDVMQASRASVKWNNKEHTPHLGYLTTESSGTKTVKSETELLVTAFKAYTDLAKLQDVLSDKFGNELLDIAYHSDKHVAVLYFSCCEAAKRALGYFERNFTVDGRSLKFSEAFIIWSLPTTNNPQKESIYSDGDRAEISANRFADNQELKYSLRSVEKYTPWVRNIYIVTNGQIPSWLDLDNPRVKIITHEEIFMNKSHLPTFSSPAIESNIFRIPGLSKKFIYMNDDVMFGDAVWPDDFYTHANGQKFYMTWPVPNCNDGCPASWINDKYCDKACNVSECDWDGGDCIGVKRGGSQFQSWSYQQSRFNLDFCHTGCADTWVGDRYCDAACNTHSCGFDAGDCGVASFHQLHSETLHRNNQEFILPNGIKSVYFNMSKIFSGKITDADHNKERVIRTAIVAQKHKLLTLTFRGNFSQTLVIFRVAGFADINDTNKVEVTFNVTVDTQHEATTTTPPTRAPVTSSDNQTTLVPTVPKPEFLPPTIYPVIINDNDRAINYWQIPNSTLPRPTWIALSQEEYKVPTIANGTVLPDDVQKKLSQLTEEFKSGYLTEKGYNRKKNKILKKFLNTPQIMEHNNTNISHYNRPNQTMTYNTHHLMSHNTRHLMSHKTRHLMSVLDWQEVEPHSSHFQFTTLADSPRSLDQPTEDERFLADWIADSKQKQLRQHHDMQNDLKKWRTRYGDWDPQLRSAETSFFPWERKGTFERFQKLQEMLGQSKSYLTKEGPRRKLLDTFADSLLHVHRIYNRKFGYVARKVPAHMPHMIDVGVMSELQELFADEFEATSSHKLRSSNDMQFAFSYMYYVMGKKASLNLTELFEELDSDHSGALSDRELRTLATRLYPLPLDLGVIRSLEKTLINCSRDLNYTAPHATWENYYDPTLPLVTESLLRACTPIMEILLNDTKKTLNKYKFETTNDEDIAFKMIRDNVTVVLNQMDGIRAKRRKFICLNDNLDHDSDTHLAKALLVDLYESLFPIPSQFELKQGYRNRFLYMDGLRAHQREVAASQYRAHSLIACGVLVVFLVLFRRKIVMLVSRLCPLRRRQIFAVGQTTRLHSV
ncbi:predicted protein [Nematostella vectensis]|uniref:N-acetylglucosamine-1-phosphotransferase subunits alpha/beta n=1 Tax=Nematostella vectensis TaxID=45351 RepID=A7S7M2_NEMVE|nr:predicted protein [Nematostella vectensis]|eukprot:XP_001632323.1 predicted protein [Nematostella vectensis]